ncbi:MAG: glycosyltransferase family 2 protein, partial [Candidatus Eiseniibacteriota bacterium]
EGPFSEDSLTEDYELPLRLAARGVHGIFVKDPVAKSADEAPPPQRSAGVREYFPDHFAAAVRQKSRWIVGIALQGWRLGWYGSLAMRYTLFRDRKALAMNLASVLGYGLVVLVLAQWLAAGLALGRWSAPAVVTPGTWVDALVRINGFFALVYLVQRAAFSWAVYGPAQAMLSVPRAVWGNVINFAASLRAIRLFVQAWRKRQRRIAWDKTQHAAMPRAKDAAMADRVP